MFCSRCGSRLPGSAHFCERCGHRVEADEPVPPPAQRRGGGIERALFAGLIGLAALAATAAVLVAVGAFEDDDPERSASPPTSAPATPTATPSPAPTASPQPEPTAEERTQPARATVQGTCGRGGVGGDCILSVRAQPSASSPELDRLSEGDSLTLTCQVRGECVYSSALGASSSVWSRTTPGGYVANVYVDGPRLSPRRITLPRC